MSDNQNNEKNDNKNSKKETVKLTHLIEMVEIYEEEQPNGQWLKSITFKLPIIPHDMDISLDNGSQVETIALLGREKVDGYVDIDLKVNNISKKGR